LNLLHITWDINPNLIEWPIQIRYYGVCFAVAFLSGYYVVKKIFLAEGQPEPWLEKMLLYVMPATIIGARLGSVFFYSSNEWWDYTDKYGNFHEGYLSHPIKILKVWEGGLASHGALIVLLVALWVFAKRISKLPYLWNLDRLAMAVPFAAGMIRLGNFFNSEILGTPTDKPWGVVFARAHRVDGVSINTIPIHPSQLYEAICYFAIFGVMWMMYWKKNAGAYLGRLVGVFLTLAFSARFLIEFVKFHQADGIANDSALTMGHWLSIPAIIAGLYLWLTSSKRPFTAPRTDNQAQKSTEYSEK